MWTNIRGGMLDVEKYNMLEIRASREQVFAKDFFQFRGVSNYAILIMDQEISDSLVIKSIHPSTLTLNK